MPRPSGLIFALAVCWTLPLLAQDTLSCAPSLSVAAVEDDPASVELTFTAPCHPYAPLEITYGPLRLREETSHQGALALQLPRLEGASAIGVDIAGKILSAPLPAAGAGVPFAAVDWGAGPVLGALAGGTGARIAQLGFRPGDGAAHLELAAGPGPFHLSVPVTDRTCGQSLTVSVARSGHATPAPLTVRLPDCEFSGVSLQVPLGGG